MGYFWTINTNDGSNERNEMVKMTQSTNNDHRWMTSSAAMVFTAYDKIIVAMQLDGHLANGGNNSKIDNHDSVMRIINFDNTNAAHITYEVWQ